MPSTNFYESQARPVQICSATGIGRLASGTKLPSVCMCVCVYDEPHSPSGSYLNKFTVRFNAIKAFGGLAGNAAVAIDVPLHMNNMPQTPFDMQNKIVHNDFNKYSQHTKTNTNIQMPRSDNNIGNGHRR